MDLAHPHSRFDPVVHEALFRALDEREAVALATSLAREELFRRVPRTSTLFTLPPPNAPYFSRPPPSPSAVPPPLTSVPLTSSPSWSDLAMLSEGEWKWLSAEAGLDSGKTADFMKALADARWGARNMPEAAPSNKLSDVLCGPASLLCGWNNKKPPTRQMPESAYSQPAAITYGAQQSVTRPLGPEAGLQADISVLEGITAKNAQAAERLAREREKPVGGSSLLETARDGFSQGWKGAVKPADRAAQDGWR